MMQLWLLVLPISLNVAAIKVPIHSDEQSSTEVSHSALKEYFQPKNSQSATDSYQPQSDDQHETTTDTNRDKYGIMAPIRYLLPPSLDAEVYSYLAEPSSGEGNWTPMAQGLPKLENGPPFKESLVTVKDSYATTASINDEKTLPQETMRQWFNPKLLEIREKSKIEGVHEVRSDADYIPIMIPSIYLQPPLSDSVSDVKFDMAVPATELQPPLYKQHPVFRPTTKKFKIIVPTISLDMKPPTPPQLKYKNPTILYPKKYSKLTAFKPISIPMRDYHDGDIQELPKAKPVKIFKPELSQIADYEELVEDEKKILKYQQAEEKRKFQEEEDAKNQQEFVDSTVEEAFASPESVSEQEASETGIYGDERDSYSAPALAAQAVVSADEPPAPAERTEFRMHGLQGPHSYKFGYDTGKGKNRQFRYEERSNDGYVKGHYGYVDRRGKTQVVNYDAHPEHGFHAEGPFGKA